MAKTQLELVNDQLQLELEKLQGYVICDMELVHNRENGNS